MPAQQEEKSQLYNLYGNIIVLLYALTATVVLANLLIAVGLPGLPTRNFLGRRSVLLHFRCSHGMRECVLPPALAAFLRTACLEPCLYAERQARM